MWSKDQYKLLPLKLYLLTVNLLSSLYHPDAKILQSFACSAFGSHVEKLDNFCANINYRLHYLLIMFNDYTGMAAKQAACCALLYGRTSLAGLWSTASLTAAELDSAAS